ncbi:MAG: FecR domain-containing protein [Tildeniella nuda ZEHNDER 1965/U140]|jgi:hypothetical protein|nr:FecR domain-containing protein [Tildeniella nuda ZEHNDER 1965/U140]
MSRNLLLIVTLILSSIGTLSLPQAANAETPLTRATVQALRNQVQLILKNRVTRAARNSDTMTPGDSLATARQSFAELRFNDSSLARIGERTLFQFVPNTRNFYLGNGTALLLIPPGQGRTNVRTPNAAAGIRGSALFVRYNEDTNTTIVGALTNSRIEVSNGETSQAQTLQAGQMAVIVQNQVVQVYNFDLNTFYQTSELVKDLDLPLSNATPSADPGIAAVQAETAQAASEQTPLTGRVSENPAFVSLTPPPGVQATLTPNLLVPTPVPSGSDLSTAPLTILPTTSQPSLPDPGSVVPVRPTLSNPDPAPSRTPTLTNPGTPTSPPSLPVQPSTPTTPAPVVTTPVQPAIPVTPAPAPIVTTPVQPSVPVTPAPAPIVTTPVQPSVPVTPAPAPAPIVTTPVQPSVPVTPAPAPIVTPPVQPVVPVTPTPAPIVTTPVQPSVPVTPAPAPRPAPALLTPTPATSVVQPTSVNATVSTPVLQVQPVITPAVTTTPASIVPGQ